MKIGPVHEALRPMLWLMGKWRSLKADGFYPTIKPFTYCEEITLRSVGQPMLNYNSVTWNDKDLRVMHLECGFLRIKPGTNEVAFMVAHNFGLATLEEGCVGDSCLQLKSVNIGRMSFGRDPATREVVRNYELSKDGVLELCVLLATSKTPLTEHLKVSYEKVEE